MAIKAATLHDALTDNTGFAGAIFEQAPAQATVFSNGTMTLKPNGGYVRAREITPLDITGSQFEWFMDWSPSTTADRAYSGFISVNGANRNGPLMYLYASGGLWGISYGYYTGSYTHTIEGGGGVLLGPIFGNGVQPKWFKWKWNATYAKLELWAAVDNSGSPGTYQLVVPANASGWTQNATNTDFTNGFWLVDTDNSGSTPDTVPIVVKGLNISTPPASVTVAPSSVSLSVGQTQQLTQTPVSTSGTPTWASDNTAVATVDSTGLVTAVSAGTAHVTATVGGVVSNQATITVSAAATITVDTSNPGLAVARGSAPITVSRVITGVTTATATVTYGAGKPTAWLTATVAQRASVLYLDLVFDPTAVQAGMYSASVTLTSPGATTKTVPTITYQVEPVVGTGVVRVVALDANGKVVRGARLTFTCDQPTLVSVSSTGVLTALLDVASPTPISGTVSCRMANKTITTLTWSCTLYPGTYFG